MLAISAGFSSLCLVKVRCGSFFSAPTGNEPKSFCCGDAGLVAQRSTLGEHPPATAPALTTSASWGRASEEQRSLQPLNLFLPPKNSGGCDPTCVPRGCAERLVHYLPSCAAGASPDPALARLRSAAEGANPSWWHGAGGWSWAQVSCWMDLVAQQRCLALLPLGVVLGAGLSPL